MKIKALDELKSVRAYLTRVGAEARSLKTAVIREQFGKYWKDLAVIRFEKDGEVSCNAQEYAPTDLEAASIKQEFATIEWPTIKPLHSIVKPPKMIKEAEPKDLFLFRDATGQIIFVQVRVEREGDKNYVPWTIIQRRQAAGNSRGVHP